MHLPALTVAHFAGEAPGAAADEVEVPVGAGAAVLTRGGRAVVGVLHCTSNKRSSAKATAGAMSPFDLQDLAICIWLQGSFASGC